MSMMYEQPKFAYDFGVTIVLLHDTNGKVSGLFRLINEDEDSYRISGETPYNISMEAIYKIEVDDRVNYIKVSEDVMEIPVKTLYRRGFKEVLTRFDNLKFRKLNQVEKLASGLIKAEE